MRVLLLPSDSTGCGSYRMILPAEVLRAQGSDVECQEVNTSLWATLAQDADGTEYVVNAGCDFDVVVLQRPCSRVLVESMRFLKAKGIRVVVELDDDLKSVPASNAAFDGVHPRLSPETNWKHLDAAIAMSDALVVTTEALRERYGQFTPTQVVPNYVPESYLKVEADKDGKTFGWPGNILSHPHDLQVTRGAIPRVMRETGATFRVVGPEGVEKLIPGTESTGWTDDYPNEVARLDVGIAPLQDTRFNQSKSWLKPLELAALGVPFVASPRAEYVRLSTLYGIGMGYLARNPKEWRKFLSLLLTDPDEARFVADFNRDRVFSHGLTIEERAEEFWRGWTGQSPPPD